MIQLDWSIKACTPRNRQMQYVGCAQCKQYACRQQCVLKATAAYTCRLLYASDLDSPSFRTTCLGLVFVRSTLHAPRKFYTVDTSCKLSSAISRGNTATVHRNNTVQRTVEKATSPTIHRCSHPHSLYTPCHLSRPRMHSSA